MSYKINTLEELKASVLPQFLEELEWLELDCLDSDFEGQVYTFIEGSVDPNESLSGYEYASPVNEDDVNPLILLNAYFNCDEFNKGKEYCIGKLLLEKLDVADFEPARAEWEKKKALAIAAEEAEN